MKFDNAVKKSLYDKEVDSFVYNPTIVVNEQIKSIKQKITEQLRKSDRIDIAVSYVVWSGLSLIYNDLRKFGPDSRILITTEGLVTDPRSMQMLRELDLSVRVYNPYLDSKGFHLKSFLFANKDDRTLLIGSNNISARAFGLAHEMAVEINSKKEGYIIERYNNVFNDLWNDRSTVVMDDQFIDGYTELFLNKRAMDSQVFEYFINPMEVKPNYMQEKALIELELTREEENRGLVIAATGTGKTYLAAFDVREMKAKKVLFLVHNRLILTSAKATFEKVFKNRKMIELYPSHKDVIYDYDFIFTTDKTAGSVLLNNVARDYFDYIIYDEAHRIGENTIYDSLINYFTPKFTLGITATPERTDKPRFLFETFKYSVPYEIRLLDALNHELVCPFTYYGLDLEEKLLDDNEQFDYDALAIYLKELLLDKGHYGEKLRALVFCGSRNEAEEISNKLNEVGYNSKFAVSGKGITEETIEKYILSLKSSDEGSVELICTVNQFNEGIDIPDVNVIIMLRNTTSSIIYLQQLGRGLRRTEDPHKFVTVFDIIGNSKNNYTIAQVLTGDQTVDKRKLYDFANKDFETVSPFINVNIEEKAMDNIIKSISNNFKVETMLKQKYREELHRYEYIPTLSELYKNVNFKELDLLQLLTKNLYDPFEKYYVERDMLIPDKFLSGLFRLITQFVFRGYDNKTLKDYVRLLRGDIVTNDILMRVLVPSEIENGITTAINSFYFRKADNNPDVFLLATDGLKLNPDIMRRLSNLNALNIFNEHIDLIELLSKDNEYAMQTFDLVDKGEFLFNVGARDCYMNVVGERIDHDKKTVYCTIKITEKESHYDNYIIDNNKVVYFTQSSKTAVQANNKVDNFVKQDYKFLIAAQFPHLGYASTSYFNLGNVSIDNISEVKKTQNGKYNHEITFLLEMEIPRELIQYKTIK